MEKLILLSFIEDSKFKFEVKKIVERSIQFKTDLDIHDNVIDPFGTLFNAYIYKKTSTEWIKGEESRRLKKTLEQDIGNFHENIISKLKGDWGSFDGVLDVKNDRMGIVAEIKNKHNTTKGNHKKNIYDDLLGVIKTDEYNNYTGYYVEIIPKSPLPFNIPFTPPDNETGLNRPKNERIRKIDGWSFYALATGTPTALRDLYQELPKVIKQVLKDLSYSNSFDLDNDDFFEGLMRAAFSRY